MGHDGNRLLMHVAVLCHRDQQDRLHPDIARTASRFILAWSLLVHLGFVGSAPLAATFLSFSLLASSVDLPLRTPSSEEQ